MAVETELRVKFESTGQDPSQRIERTRKSANDLNRSLNRTGRSAREGLGDVDRGARQSTESLAQVGIKLFAIVTAFRAVVAAGRGAFDLLITQNDRLQQEITTTASTISALNNVQVDGRQITDPVEAITALQPELEKTLETIENTAAGLAGVTGDELRQAFNAVITDVGVVNGSLEETVAFSADFVQAFKAAGVPTFQLRSELRAIASGQRLINSQVAQVVGIREDELKLAIQQGRQTEFLTERFQRFGAAAQLNSDLLTTNLSTLQSVIQQLGREAGGELTPRLQESVKAFTNIIQDNKDELLELAGIISGILVVVFDQLEKAVDAYTIAAGNSFETTNEGARNAAEDLKLIVGGIGNIITAWASVQGFISRGINILIGAFNRLLSTVRGITAVIGAIGQGELLPTDFEGIQRVFNDAAKASEELKETEEERGVELENTKDKTEQLLSVQKELNDEFRRTSTALEIELLREQAAIQQQIVDGTKTEVQATSELREEKIANLRAREDEIAASIEALRVNQEQLTQEKAILDTEGKILDREKQLQSTRLSRLREEIAAIREVQKETRKLSSIESKRLELRSREIITSIDAETEGLKRSVEQSQDLLDLENERAKLVSLNNTLSQHRLGNELTSLNRISQIQERLQSEDIGANERRALIQETETLLRELGLSDNKTSTLIKARFELETRIAKLKNDQAIADINAEQRKLELARQRAKAEANIARNQLEVESIRAQRSSFEATNARIELEADPEANAEQIKNAREAERLSQELVETINSRGPAIDQNLQNELKELDVLEQQLNVQRQIVQERQQFNAQTRRFSSGQDLAQASDQRGSGGRDARRLERLERLQQSSFSVGRQRRIDRLRPTISGQNAISSTSRPIVPSAQAMNDNRIVEGLRKVENAIKRRTNPRVLVNVDGARATEQQVTQSEMPDSLSILENA